MHVAYEGSGLLHSLLSLFVCTRAKGIFMTTARKKRLPALLGLALSVLWLLSASRVRAEDVVNGSFEIPALGSNYKYNPTGTGVGWTFVGASGIQGNGSAWNGANAPNGVQTAVIQNLGTFSQTINFNAGSHTLSVQAARRLQSIPAGSVQPIKVSIDGQQIGSLISPASTSFSLFTIPFSIATSGVHTLSFAGTLGTTGDDVSTFIDEVVVTGPPHITFGPTDISPNSFFYVLGTDFGDQAGTISIHFPKGPSTTDLSVPIGQPSSQWWYPGLTGGTVNSALAGVVEQTVDITITTKDGKKSNAWQATFHPRMVAAHLPQSRVMVAACSDGAHMNSCNHIGDESGECPFGFATEGIPPPASNSFGGHHHGCFGISSDNGTDVFSASLKNGWTFESLENFGSTTLNSSNGVASTPQTVPTLAGVSSIKMSVNWHIGATGGYVGYQGDLTITGPKGVSF
ncbi:MAG TPA: hypothetical protein VNZ27_14210 [Rhodanobacter sp.]|jgi:hypothetical protein|nr:hypothetical protein [Rhodanobacter sp.]